MIERIYRFGNQPVPVGAFHELVKERGHTFVDKFREFGMALEVGFMVTTEKRVAQIVFTGDVLCEYGTAALYTASKKKFGSESAIKVVRANVQTVEGKTRHYWLRALQSDNSEIFADVAHGQVKGVPDYIATGNVEDERTVFDYKDEPEDVTDKIRFFYQNKIDIYERLSIGDLKYKTLLESYRNLLAVLTV